MKRLLMHISRTITVCLLLTIQPVMASDDAVSEAALDQMLAPIALYPDTVLTHVLIASTYPLEVVQASRWVKKHPDIDANDAVNAVEDQDWDPSVKALVAFPQLLERLSTDLDWTEQLGEAFLQDETLVLARIQMLRQKAYDNGTLTEDKHVVVARERNVIVIEPARKEIVYVPVYDTRVVYGNWWWPAYPPVYWTGPGVYYSSSPFYWGVSVNVRPWFYFGVFDWHQRHIVVNHNYYYKPPRYYPKRHDHYANANRWQHDSHHRRGVHYRHDKLNHQYNGGYSTQQRTNEYKGKPQPHRVTADGKVVVRESKPVYQRKTADQVRMPERKVQREQQTVTTDNRRQQRPVDAADNRVRVQQELKASTRPTQQTQPARERQVTTDVRMQREQRPTRQEAPTPVREQRIDQQPQRRADVVTSRPQRIEPAQPMQRAAPVQQVQRSVSQPARQQATRDMRQSTASTHSNRGGNARSID